VLGALRIGLIETFGSTSVSVPCKGVAAFPVLAIALICRRSESLGRHKVETI
jgi:hypothetical protein